MKRERAELEVRLFGHPSVFAAGAPIKFAKQTTSLALLAIVNLLRGRPIARDALAFTLFPDDDEATALAHLRRYLLNVRAFCLIPFASCEGARRTV